MARKVLLVLLHDDSDVFETMSAIASLSNVASVENVAENVDQQIGYFRAKAELQEKIWKVLKE